MNEMLPATSTLPEPSPARLGRVNFPSILPYISKVVIIGSGDVVKTKVWPALLALGLKLRIALVGLEAESRLNTLPHTYYQILQGNTLPADDLDEDGFSGKQAFVYVATSSKFHVSYALQAAELGARVAPEKPLAHSARAANLLLPLAGRGQMFGMDHFLFKEGSTAMFDVLDKNPEALKNLARIEFIYYETAGFALGRQQENGIQDMLYHGFSMSAAVLNRISPPVHVAFNDVSVATHRADPFAQYDVAHVPTASRILAEVSLLNGLTVELDLRQAKGAPASVKLLRLLDGKGNLILEADLSESGFHPHTRMIQELLKPQPNVHLDLQDHIFITDWVEQARNRARDKGFHNFTELPDFLLDQ